MENKTLTFYDGDCGFCNWSVSFFLNRNPGHFYFAPLQGKTAEEVLGVNNPLRKDLSTLVVKTKEGRVLTKSSAALYLLTRSRSIYRPISFLGWLFPKFIRDFIYDLVAKNRKHLVGAYCVVPAESQRQYLLD